MRTKGNATTRYYERWFKRVKAEAEANGFEPEMPVEEEDVTKLMMDVWDRVVCGYNPFPLGCYDSSAWKKRAEKVGYGMGKWSEIARAVGITRCAVSKMFNAEVHYRTNKITPNVAKVIAFIKMKEKERRENDPSNTGS